MADEFEPLMDANEAASLLQVHPKTLQLMARQGRVPAVRVGKFWRFRKTEINRWLQSASRIQLFCCACRSNEEKSS